MNDLSKDCVEYPIIINPNELYYPSSDSTVLLLVPVNEQLCTIIQGVPVYKYKGVSNHVN